MPEQMIEDFVLKEDEQEKRKNKNEKAALRRDCGGRPCW
jgi:hypothetical protein